MLFAGLLEKEPKQNKEQPCGYQHDGGLHVEVCAKVRKFAERKSAWPKPSHRYTCAWLSVAVNAAGKLNWGRVQ